MPLLTTDLSNGTTLTDWNMLVRLSETDSTVQETDSAIRARSNGGDLRFIDKYGSELKYEIAKWNPSGESHVWVNVPTLKSDANITMYWGNPSAGLPTYASDGSVWKDYFGVYHLEQASGPAQDSSPLNNHLTLPNSPVLESSGLAGNLIQLPILLKTDLFPMHFLEISVRKKNLSLGKNSQKSNRLAGMVRVGIRFK